MSLTRLYLDWNAGAPMRAVVRAQLIAALERVGNASSVHAEGRAARAAVDGARRAVAALVGGDPRFVIFTSGGTEANVTVLAPAWTRGGKPLPFDRLLVSAVEHPSVARGGRFQADRVEIIPVDGDGVVDVAALERRLAALSAAGETAMVSVMVANNETGVIQPIARIVDVVHSHGGVLHADAVQAVGRIEVDIAALGADVLTLSAHKIGGPQGVGAIVRRSDRLAFPPLLTGGGQESFARAGTEPVALVEAFGVAAAAASDDLKAMDGVRARRDAAEAAVRAVAPDAVVFSAAAERLPNTLSFAVPGMAAETAVIAFDLAGLAISSGSACSSGKVTRSPVLTAMGFSADLAAGGLRVSIGPTTADGDIERFASVFAAVHGRLKRGVSPQAA
jgi:cysteine desulfurase